MRRTVNTLIQDIWEAGGPFIGDDGAPHGRVTVEEGWLLHRSSSTGSVVGSYTKGPIRYFQRADNGQTETEILNVKSIATSRSIDTDAASCTIIISNTKMLANGVDDNGELGQPGYFTFNRGCSDDAATRWGQDTNEWHDVLVPNALIRTYQGYGGKTKSITDAVADGNILQTGLWLVDEVNPQANGTLELRCRDMGKLLIDQNLYPPLVPSNQFPLFYYRFKNIDHPSIPYGTTVYGAGYTGVPVGYTSTEAPTLEYESSSSELGGYPGENAVDFGDPDSYWLSDGHATGDTTADMEYIQFKPTAGTMDMSACNLWPWGGGYEIYVSVMVGGVWQGANTIPYTGSGSGFNIKYIQIIGTVGWEQPFLKGLQDGPYVAAQRIRFTFFNLVRSSIGSQYFRAGVRDVSAGVMTTTVTGGGRTILGMARSAVDTSNGYWLCGTDGGVFSFGDAQFYGSMAGTPLLAPIVGIAPRTGNSGYWLAAADGGVFSFGAAHFYGSIPSIGETLTSPVLGIERSAGGLGYYLFTAAGQVYAFGDAVYAGNASFGGVCTGMAVRPQGGYWLVDNTGAVDSFGGAGYHLGGPSGATSISSTSTGAGYWITDGAGAVYARGDANYFGGLTSYTLNDPVSDIEGFDDDSGYWMTAEDGGVFTFGAGHNFWGSLPQAFDVEVAGNYSDWLDIIKDLLLWSGFWLYETLGPTDAPAVFGNLESTGAFALDNLTEDFFDKKPIIDVIHTIKEIVGYLAYVGDVGEFHFHPFNLWTIGNYYDDDGSHTTAYSSIDEALQMTAYQTVVSDRDARTDITIASSDPLAGLTDTITTTRESIWGQAMLKGIVRNALWINAAFISPVEQEIMAELVDLYLFMAQRQGNVTCSANPTIQINDQVRIWERQTAETYMHFVRGIETNMDCETGEYTMTLTSHWLGDGSAWFLAYE